MRTGPGTPVDPIRCVPVGQRHCAGRVVVDVWETSVVVGDVTVVVADVATVFD